MSEQQNPHPASPLEAPSGESAAGEGQLAAGPVSPEAESLLALVDRLTSMLEKSDLVELEIESGGTGLILRKPAALATTVAGVNLTLAAPGGGVGGGEPEGGRPGAAEAAPVSTLETVRAPLTGIFYASSSPSSPPYVTVGQRIESGQVIGLIEAMKLFNEIKSDRAGRIVRMVAETGKLVRAKQPLIELEP